MQRTKQRTNERGVNMNIRDVIANIESKLSVEFPYFDLKINIIDDTDGKSEIVMTVNTPRGEFNKAIRWHRVIGGHDQYESEGYCYKWIYNEFKSELKSHFGGILHLMTEKTSYFVEKVNDFKTATVRRIVKSVDVNGDFQCFALKPTNGATFEFCENFVDSLFKGSPRLEINVDYAAKYVDDSRDGNIAAIVIATKKEFYDIIEQRLMCSILRNNDFSVKVFNGGDVEVLNCEISTPVLL